MPKYEIKVKFTKHEQRMVNLFDKRRSMTLVDITKQIRNRVSIYGIYNSASKQKEVILNFEQQIKELKDELATEKTKIKHLVSAEKCRID